MKFHAIFLTLLLSSVTHATEISVEGKKYIAHQVATYMEKGANGMIEFYLAGGPAMDEKSANEIISGMAQLESMCGKPVGFSVKKIVGITENTANAFFVIDLEKCPVFFRQVLYRTKSGKVIAANFYMHTQPEQVWPNEIIYQH